MRGMNLLEAMKIVDAESEEVSESLGGKEVIKDDVGATLEVGMDADV
jgi:hypothetical protein